MLHTAVVVLKRLQPSFRYILQQVNAAASTITAGINTQRLSPEVNSGAGDQLGIASMAGDEFTCPRCERSCGNAYNLASHSKACRDPKRNSYIIFKLWKCPGCGLAIDARNATNIRRHQAACGRYQGHLAVDAAPAAGAKRQRTLADTWTGDCAAGGEAGVAKRGGLLGGGCRGAEEVGDAGAGVGLVAETVAADAEAAAAAATAAVEPTVKREGGSTGAVGGVRVVVKEEEGAVGAAGAAG